jgi:hypothetical protein
MNILKSIVLGVLLSLSITSAYALKTILLNYTQLVKAVEFGDDVRAIVHFDNCDLMDPENQNQIIRNQDGVTTRFNFTKFLHFKIRINSQLKDTVTTSIVSYLDMTTGEKLTLFGRLSVFDDNTATVHVDLFDPMLHKNKLVIDWLCDISNGNDRNGLVLFDSP